MKRALIYILLVPTLFVVIGSLYKNFVLDTPLVRSYEAAAKQAERAADESEKVFDEEQRRKLQVQPLPTSSPDVISSSPSPDPIPKLILLSPSPTPTPELIPLSPSPTAYAINTEEQLEARNRAASALKQIDLIVLQEKNVIQWISESKKQVKICEQHALSANACLSTKAYVLRGQLELERLNKQSQELLKKANANMCIVDPLRSGC